MENNLVKQRKLLEILGSIDAQLSIVEITKENLEKEVERLKKDKRETLVNCQHVDEDGQLVIAGGALLAWCQICGTLLTDGEIKELEE